MAPLKPGDKFPEGVKFSYVTSSRLMLDKSIEQFTNLRLKVGPN